MDPVKVSVIVPCYNVAPYLSRCLESLEKQTLKEIQILAVNDGSADETHKLLEEWKEKLGERLEVFHKENGGLSDARNFGLARATGEYVAFLDGDDFIDSDLFASLYQRAKETGADITACPVLYQWKTKAKRVSSRIPAFAEGDEIKKVFTEFYPAVWNKFYLRTFLQETGVLFQKGVFFEDVEFSHRLLPFCRRIASVEGPAVHYVQREGSITASADTKLFDYPKNFATVLSFFKEKNLLPQWEKELEFAAARYLLATFLKRAAKLSFPLHKKAVEDALSFLEENFPQWRKNPYLAKKGLKGVYLRRFHPVFTYLMRGKFHR